MGPEAQIARPVTGVRARIGRVGGGGAVLPLPRGGRRVALLLVRGPGGGGAVVRRGAEGFEACEVLGGDGCRAGEDRGRVREVGEVGSEVVFGDFGSGDRSALQEMRGFEVSRYLVSQGLLFFFWNPSCVLTRFGSDPSFFFFCSDYEQFDLFDCYSEKAGVFIHGGMLVCR